VRKILTFLLISSFLFFYGCKAFELSKDSTGKEHTQIESTLNTASQIIKEASPAANAFFPGVGLIGTAIAGLLGLIGHGITTAVVASKRKDALTTVVQGVEQNAGDFQNLSANILDILKAAPEIKSKVENLLSDFIPVKKAVQNVSKIKDNTVYLDKHVQKITHKVKNVS